MNYLPLPVLQDLVIAKLNSDLPERLTLSEKDLGLQNSLIRLAVLAARIIESSISEGPTINNQ